MAFIDRAAVPPEALPMPRRPRPPGTTEVTTRHAHRKAVKARRAELQQQSALFGDEVQRALGYGPANQSFDVLSHNLTAREGAVKTLLQSGRLVKENQKQRQEFERKSIEEKMAEKRDRSRSAKGGSTNTGSNVCGSTVRETVRSDSALVPQPPTEGGRRGTGGASYASRPVESDARMAAAALNDFNHQQQQHRRQMSDTDGGDGDDEREAVDWGSNAQPQPADPAVGANTGDDTAVPRGRTDGAAGGPLAPLRDARGHPLDSSSPSRYQTGAALTARSWGGNHLGVPGSGASPSRTPRGTASHDHPGGVQRESFGEGTDRRADAAALAVLPRLMQPVKRGRQLNTTLKVREEAHTEYMAQRQAASNEKALVLARRRDEADRQRQWVREYNSEAASKRHIELEKKWSAAVRRAERLVEIKKAPLRAQAADRLKEREARALLNVMNAEVQAEAAEEEQRQRRRERIAAERRRRIIESETKHGRAGETIPVAAKRGTFSHPFVVGLRSTSATSATENENDDDRGTAGDRTASDRGPIRQQRPPGRRASDSLRGATSGPTSPRSDRSPVSPRGQNANTHGSPVSPGSMSMSLHLQSTLHDDSEAQKNGSPRRSAADASNGGTSSGGARHTRPSKYTSVAAAQPLSLQDRRERDINAVRERRAAVEAERKKEEEEEKERRRAAELRKVKHVPKPPRVAQIVTQRMKAAMEKKQEDDRREEEKRKLEEAKKKNARSPPRPSFTPRPPQKQQTQESKAETARADRSPNRTKVSPKKASPKKAAPPPPKPKAPAPKPQRKPSTNTGADAAATTDTKKAERTSPTPRSLSSASSKSSPRYRSLSSSHASSPHSSRAASSSGVSPRTPHAVSTNRASPNDAHIEQNERWAEEAEGAAAVLRAGMSKVRAMWADIKAKSEVGSPSAQHLADLEETKVQCNGLKRSFAAKLRSSTGINAAPTDDTSTHEPSNLQGTMIQFENDDEKEAAADFLEEMLKQSAEETSNVALVEAIIATVDLDYSALVDSRGLATMCASDGNIEFVKPLLEIDGLDFDAVEFMCACFFNQSMRVPLTLLALSVPSFNLSPFVDELQEQWQEFFEDIASEKRAIPREKRDDKMPLLEKMIGSTLFKIDGSVQGADGLTVFARACVEGDFQVASLLAQAHLVPAPTALNEDGTTVLISAVIGNSADCVRLILADAQLSTVDVKHRSENGTALDMAELLQRDPAIVDLLKARLAAPPAEEKDGNEIRRHDEDQAAESESDGIQEDADEPKKKSKPSDIASDNMFPTDSDSQSYDTPPLAPARARPRRGSDESSDFSAPPSPTPIKSKLDDDTNDDAAPHPADARQGETKPEEDALAAVPDASPEADRKSDAARGSSSDSDTFEKSSSSLSSAKAESVERESDAVERKSVEGNDQSSAKSENDEQEPVGLKSDEDTEKKEDRTTGEAVGAGDEDKLKSIPEPSALALQSQAESRVSTAQLPGMEVSVSIAPTTAEEKAALAISDSERKSATNPGESYASSFRTPMPDLDVSATPTPAEQKSAVDEKQSAAPSDSYASSFRTPVPGMEASVSATPATPGEGQDRGAGKLATPPTEKEDDTASSKKPTAEHHSSSAHASGDDVKKSTTASSSASSSVSSTTTGKDSDGDESDAYNDSDFEKADDATPESADDVIAPLGAVTAAATTVKDEPEAEDAAVPQQDAETDDAYGESDFEF